MLRDRYDNALSTGSAGARDAYVDGVDLFLSANAGAVDSFERAIAADDGFALAYLALARSHQALGRSGEADAALRQVRALADGTSVREQAHIAALGALIDGDGAGAFMLMREHLIEYPRDALILQPCTGVFGLIGFSGAHGREAAQLAFLEPFVRAYGDDWWFKGQQAFAEIETGRVSQALRSIDTALTGNPRNANAAHIRAHIYYEQGEADAGFSYLDAWAKDYDEAAPLHCHVNWHLALWLLERGDDEAAWRTIRENVVPDRALGPAINVMTDTASFLFRAEIGGGEQQTSRAADLWPLVSQYARAYFPEPGVAFADVHAALAHAMAGEAEALQRIITDATGPAADVVRDCAEAFGAFAAGHYADAVSLLAPRMSEHERVGGSRAQRDLIEYALVAALLRLGRSEEAALMLMTRRPMRVNDPARPVTAPRAIN